MLEEEDFDSEQKEFLRINWIKVQRKGVHGLGKTCQSIILELESHPLLLIDMTQGTNTVKN